MPLNPTAAKSSLGSLFANPVDNEADARSAWADAIQSLCAAIIPASTTVAAAAATLESALSGFSADNATAAALESALVTFAATVGGGMAGYTAVPPVAPVGVSFSNTDDAQAAADAFVDTVNTWLKTGTATLISPPGSPINWS